MTTTSRPNPANPSAAKTASRRALIVSLVVIAALIGAFFLFSALFTEFLWYEQLGMTTVLLRSWLAASIMFVLGFLGMAVPLALCLQLAYRMRPVYVRLSSQLDRYQEVVEPLRKLGMWLVPIFFGVFAGLAAAGNWQVVWLWWSSAPTGQVDPEFGMDVSFFLFDMPFYSILLGFVSAVVLISLGLTAAVSYLYGSVRVGQRELRISKAARIQLAILAALYLLVQAASLWLDRYITLVKADDRIIGAGYTTVNAVIPGLAILSILAVVIAILFLVTAIIGRWRYPLVGTALLIVASLVLGIAFPWGMRTFQVQPNQNALQAEFYQRNLDATKAAFDIAGLEKTPFEVVTDVTAGQLREDADTTASIRIMDPAVVSPTIQQLEQYRAYYQVKDPLDVDRYQIDGAMQDTIVAVRELNLSQLSDADNWNNRAVMYTHGYGLVAAAGNQRTTNGEPVFLEQGMPTSGFLTAAGGFEPRVYFGEFSPEYSIVGAPEGTPPVEIDYVRSQGDGSDTKTTFTGNGGPQMSNTFIKMLFALKFQSEQIMFSDYVTEESQILFDRHPLLRVQKVAPYLVLDNDPYPTVVDGRIVWVVDGYTTSATYPYSTSVSLSEAIADSNTTTARFAVDEINYIRNSVKATVDAYDGSVKLYAWDEEDPILKAWQNIYPATVAPITEMSGDLMSHVRYPTDLFKVQRSMLGVYHVEDALSFALRDNAWQTPNDPQDASRLQSPYYLSMQMPGQDSPHFSMFTTFIPAAQGTSSRNVLTGYLAVDSDAGNATGVKAPGYGQLRLLEIDADTTVPGPGQVQNTFNSDAGISQQLNVLTLGRSEVLHGNLLTLPVGGGLLYVQPVFVQSAEGTQLPRLQKILVAFGDRIAFEDTLTAALDSLFGGDSGASAGDEDLPTDSGATNTEPSDSGGAAAPSGPDPSVTDQRTVALQAAQKAMMDRDAALKAGDLKAFAAADDRLAEAVRTLLALEEALVAPQDTSGSGDGIGGTTP